MIVKPADELRELVTKILRSAGANEPNAVAVAQHLVLANLCGVDTHGVCHVAGYVKDIREGLIVPTAWPEVHQETASTALVSGHWTFGQTGARFAMEVAIEKAKAENVAIVSLVQTHHIGRLGHYVEMAAGDGLISMVWAGGYGAENPAAMPYGGRQPLLHTNPIAMGFPAGDEPPMMFDFATTGLAGVKVLTAHNQKQQLPPGYIVDRQGNPTTNPADFYDGGGHLPFGEHKGYAVMMAAEFLGRIFSGADALADPDRGGPIMRRQGVTLIVFRADLFQTLDDYATRVDELERKTREILPAPGFTEVLVPGDPERRTQATRERDGIPIEDELWHSIVECASSLGVEN